MLHKHTPFAGHTDAELVLVVCNKDHVTDLELELVQRLENKDNEIEDLRSELAECGFGSVVGVGV